jgi:tetrahydromethanopterin S-methyltransferase subunit G
MVILRRDMAEKIPSWLERVLLPQISELKGEVKVLHTRIDGLGEKIDGAERRLESKIGEADKRLGDKIDEVDKRLCEKIDEVDKRLESKIDDGDKRLESMIAGVDMRLGAKIDGLDKRLDMTQRLAVVEAQLKELRAKA